jgi:hypothetical protein
MKVLFLWSAALLLTITSHGAAAASHLVATLRNSSPPGTHDRVVVMLALTNDGDQPVHVFEPATPFLATGGRLPRDQFHVVDAFGHRAPYRGVWVNWGGMPRSLFRLVKPGETIEKTIDLTDEYDFGNGGAITIRYDLAMDWEPEVGTAQRGDHFVLRRGDQRVVSSNELSVIAPPYRPRSASAALVR